MSIDDQTARGCSPAATLEPLELASGAYRTLVRHVDDLALVVLHASEAALIRDAADACLFDDEDAVQRVTAACELLAQLSEFGRLEAHAAARLSDELAAVDGASRRLAARSS